MTTRLLTLVGLVVALACLSTPAALAGSGGPPLNGVGYDGRSPDTKDAAALAHSGRSVSASRATTPAGPSLNGVGYDGRSPDTKDAGVSVRTVPQATVLVAAAAGFDWTDAGIGAGAGFGLALVVVAGFALTRSRGGVAAAS